MSTPPQKNRAAAGASWMALLAATTLGSGDFDLLRTEISAEPGVQTDDKESYRLVVHSYASDSVDANGPQKFARPSASVQRPITAEELRSGVAVDLVNVGEAVENPVIVAWLERGPADLDFDALKARPTEDAWIGSAERAHVGASHVVLKART